MELWCKNVQCSLLSSTCSSSSAALKASHARPSIIVANKIRAAHTQTTIRRIASRPMAAGTRIFTSTAKIRCNRSQQYGKIKVKYKTYICLPQSTHTYIHTQILLIVNIFAIVYMHTHIVSMQSHNATNSNNDLQFEVGDKLLVLE